MKNKTELKQRLEKALLNQPVLLPTFYATPYAASNPGQPTDYALTWFPTTIDCGISLAFITPGVAGNTSDDTYICSVSDRGAIQDFIAAMQKLGRRIILSFIDTPTTHWDSINITNFVRNIIGQMAPDGTIITNDLCKNYPHDGLMFDAETDAITAFAETMKQSFLAGVTLDPENFIFVYTTYANRPIDQQILTMEFDETKSTTDADLIELGFLRFIDLFTKRGPSLSYIETMSYGSDAASRMDEADTYAGYLTLGDATLLNDRRKYISIGVAPLLTSDADVVAIGAACDPTKEDGYGRFMVWAGNCPEGLRLFNLAFNARQPSFVLPKTEPLLPVAMKPLINKGLSGNRDLFFNEVTNKKTSRPKEISGDKAPKRSWFLGLFSSCCSSNLEYDDVELDCQTPKVI